MKQLVMLRIDKISWQFKPIWVQTVSNKSLNEQGWSLIHKLVHGGFQTEVRTDVKGSKPTSTENCSKKSGKTHLWWAQSASRYPYTPESLWSVPGPEPDPEQPGPASVRPRRFEKSCSAARRWTGGWSWADRSWAGKSPKTPRPKKSADVSASLLSVSLNCLTF